MSHGEIGHVVHVKEGEPCPHNERIASLEDAVQPMRFVSLKNLVLVVTLIGAPTCIVGGLAMRWWISQDFVTTKGYERDRKADAELDQAQRQRLSDALESLSREVRGYREDTRGLRRSGVELPQLEPFPYVTRGWATNKRESGG